MGINIGILEEGFTAPVMKIFWLAAVSIMTVICIVLWIFCFKRETKLIAYCITVITALIFMLSGLLQVKTLLLTFCLSYRSALCYKKIYGNKITANKQFTAFCQNSAEAFYECNFTFEA